jgi:hypothetical protein
MEKDRRLSGLFLKIGFDQAAAGARAAFFAFFSDQPNRSVRGHQQRMEAQRGALALNVDDETVGGCL